jgi:hypothetical protein
MTRKALNHAPVSGVVAFFDPDAFKAAQRVAVPDVVIRHPGTLQVNTPGSVKWHEVCQKCGMQEKARKAWVGWYQAERQVVIVPAEFNSAKALSVTWSPTQKSGRIRLRSFFMNFGVELPRHSAWELEARVEQVPEVGWALVIDLDEAIVVAEVYKKAAGTLLTGNGTEA